MSVYKWRPDDEAMLWFIVAVLAFALLFSSGCVIARVDHPEFGKVKYIRIGGQELDDIRLTVNSNTVFTIGRQAADGDEIGEVAESVTKGMVEAVKIGYGVP